MRQPCNHKDIEVLAYKAYIHHLNLNSTTPRQCKSSKLRCKKCFKVWRSSAKYVDNLSRKHPTPYVGMVVFKEED